jgi:phage terminase small subunit
MQKRNTLNKRQQLFCHYLTEGESQARAYLKAGFKANTIQQAGSNAIRLMRTERVASYLAKLKEVQFTKQALSYAEKRAFLARAVRTSVGEIHEGSDLAQEVTITEGKEGTSRRVKAVDKLRAIELDSKLAGDFYADRTPQASNPFLMIVSLGKNAGTASLLGETQSVPSPAILRETSNVIEAEIVEHDIANDPLP